MPFAYVSTPYSTIWSYLFPLVPSCVHLCHLPWIPFASWIVSLLLSCHLSFSRSHVCDKTCHLSFCVCLILLNMISSSTQFIPNGIVFLFLYGWITFHFMYVLHFLLVINWQAFHILAIVYCATISMEMQILHSMLILTTLGFWRELYDQFMWWFYFLTFE